ncbi:hypothetical protein [Streptomyces acidicola]|uniref:hypothetical protein n=1 Tax=Streptomyces acidicola TaxID=2596892 RepID=UPI003427AAB0
MTSLWDAALADPDRRSALHELRRTLSALKEMADAVPSSITGLWIPFVAAMTDSRFHQILTEADFDLLETVGEQLAATGQLALDDAWRPLVEARRGRGEQQAAAALLTRLYWADQVSDEVRAATAAELAGADERGAAQLEVYADLLRRPGRRPPAVTALVAEIFDVGFDTGPTQLGRAAAVAKRAAGRQPPLPGVNRVIGLHLLLVGDEPAKAVGHFEQACDIEPGDETALLGLLAARIRSGEPALAAVAARRMGRDAPPGVAGMEELARALAWLDSDTEAHTDTSGLPLRADRLAALDLPEVVGPWHDYARGRMFLVEGDARQARAVLVALAERHPGHPEWTYHAAWAQLLSGDRAGLEPLFGKLTGRESDWALDCLLLDVDRERVTVGSVPRAFARAAAVRAELRDGRRPPAVLGMPPGVGAAPERLEALRTALGAAYAREDRAAMARLLAQPLHRRLPHADRLLWSGLLALETDPAEGRRLLAEALEGGHERAALALSAYHLREGRTAQVRTLLRGRDGARARVLLAWAEAVDGDDTAAITRLQPLRDRSFPLAAYALTAVRLHQYSALPVQERHEGRHFLRHAVSDLEIAMMAAPGVLPARAPLLARAAETLLRFGRPDDEAGPRAPADPPPERPGAPIRAEAADLWTNWVLGLAGLAEDPENADPEMCEGLLEMAEATRSPTGPGVAGLAAALARAAMTGRDPGRRRAFSALLRRLADGNTLPAIQQSAARTEVASTVPGEQIRAVVGEPLVALALVREDLRTNRRDEAVARLRALPAGDGTEQRVCALLANALEGRPPEPLPDDVPPEIVVPLRVVHLAGLAATAPERCLDMLAGMPADDMLTTVVDVERLLPLLCARAGRGRRRPGRPTSLLADTVRRFAHDDGRRLDPLTLARCATAVQAHDVADELWQRAARATYRSRDAGRDVQAEYVRYLCHRAALAWQAGDPLSAARLLHRAGAAPHDGRGAGANTGLEGLARDLEMEVLAGRLIRHILPPGPETSPAPRRPGRHAALEEVIEADPGLRTALLGDDPEGVGGAWAVALKRPTHDTRLVHTLAVVHREQALARPAPDVLSHTTALWTLLLASESFWAFREGEDHFEERLRAEVCRELLGLHRKYGADALQNGDPAAARTHLRVLDACRDGPAAAQNLLADSAPALHQPVDPGRWSGISALAAGFVDEWCYDVILAARKVTGDRKAVARLREGISKDFESGIRHLEPLVRLGVPLLRPLRVGLDWYNEWQFELYRLDDLRELGRVTRNARRFADALAPLCTPGQALKRENQALSTHFMFRGFVAPGRGDKLASYHTSLKWNPHNDNAASLLEDTRGWAS